jgi:transposase InsO family protein
MFGGQDAPCIASPLSGQSSPDKSSCLAESFFHTLKTELVYFETYHTREDARNSVFEYIETYYNRFRMHSTINYCSPVQFEQRWIDTKAA